MTDELKPCAFCGSYHVHVCTIPTGYRLNPRVWYVKCDDCESRGKRVFDKLEAIAAWNTRAELGSDREAELIRAMEDVLRHSTDTVWAGEAETLVDRMVSLGVYGHEVYEGARPWEVGE